MGQHKEETEALFAKNSELREVHLFKLGVDQNATVYALSTAGSSAFPFFVFPVHLPLVLPRSLQT